MHTHLQLEDLLIDSSGYRASREKALLSMVTTNHMNNLTIAEFISTLQGDAIENMVLADANSLFIQRALELEDVQSRRSGVSSNRTASNG